MASVDHRGIRRSREAIETSRDRIRSKLVISVEKRDEFGGSGLQTRVACAGKTAVWFANERGVGKERDDWCRAHFRSVINDEDLVRNFLLKSNARQRFMKEISVVLGLDHHGHGLTKRRSPG